MGSCMGRCLPKSEPFLSCRSNSGDSTNGVDFTYLIEDNVSLQENKKSFLERLLAKRKARQRPKKPVLELVDEILNPQVTSYCRLSESQRLPSTSFSNDKDIPLQCLDARALLARTTTSTPVSSVDLEWEHETLPISMIHDASGSSWTALPEDFLLDAECGSEATANRSDATNRAEGAIVAANSDSDWSRVSSANSLEWDNVQHCYQPSASPVSEVDTDTQLLLHEIEQLTSQTLQETGREIYS